MPRPLDDGHVQLLYSTRDAAGRSHVARARLRCANDRLEAIEHQEQPLLGPGALGAFDDSGVTTSCVVADGDRLLLYYTGWSLGKTVPFYLFAGLAVSEDGGRTFARSSPAPLLERTAADPYLTASPFVMRDGGMWRMWYVSGVGWNDLGGSPSHLYHLRYAESDDGILWRRAGRVAVDFAGAQEYAFGRPCVVKDRDRYRMWYSFRGAAYQLGYAESGDGCDWRRLDAQAGLYASPSGWDSEMVAYPYVFDIGRTRYMLYNGNGYGRTGIGYATMDAP